jgi:fructose-1,6-bisphosphatase I
MSGITLSHYVLTREKSALGPQELALIMGQLSLVARRMAHGLSQASLLGALGYTGSVNVQGEKAKKLDNWANEVFIDAFSEGHAVCSLISEEMEQVHHLTANCGARSYAMLFDPLDGSSNTDVNGSLGTIFALRPRAKGHGAELSDLFKPATSQLLAGYILYGPATQLVYTCGAGVRAFTLDTGVGEFVLWRDNVRMPSSGPSYAVNQANYDSWHPAARRLVDSLTHESENGRKHSLRYSGTFVADFHRCLLEGGIYLYPREAAAGAKGGGKLRLMYEVAPLAMVAEAAGGRASTGSGRVMEVIPAKIHERVPVYIGSSEEVLLAERLEAQASSQTIRAAG